MVDGQEFPAAGCKPIIIARKTPLATSLQLLPCATLHRYAGGFDPQQHVSNHYHTTCRKVVSSNTLPSKGTLAWQGINSLCLIIQLRYSKGHIASGALRQGPMESQEDASSEPPPHPCSCEITCHIPYPIPPFLLRMILTPIIYPLHLAPIPYPLLHPSSPTSHVLTVHAAYCAPPSPPSV